MVDRIVPATTPADIAALEAAHGYADARRRRRRAFPPVGDRGPLRRPPPAVGSRRRRVRRRRHALRAPEDARPQRRPVDPRLSRRPRRPRAHLRRRRRPAPRSLRPRGCSPRRACPTLAPVPGTDPVAYLDQSLARLRNRAIRHTCHQIATDGSQKLPQRLVNPAAERLARGEPAPRLTVAVAAWMAWLVRASDRFGRQWRGRRPRGRPRRRHRRPHRRRRRRRSSPASSPSTPSSPPPSPPGADFRAGLARALAGSCSRPTRSAP